MAEFNVWCDQRKKELIIDIASYPAGEICPGCEGTRKECNFKIVPVKAKKKDHLPGICPSQAC